MKSIKKYETIINEALRSALEYDTPEGQINEFISFFGKHIGSDRIYIFEDDEEHHVTMPLFPLPLNSRPRDSFSVRAQRCSSLQDP